MRTAREINGEIALSVLTVVTIAFAAVRFFESSPPFLSLRNDSIPVTLGIYVEIACFLY